MRKLLHFFLGSLSLSILFLASCTDDELIPVNDNDDDNEPLEIEEEILLSQVPLVQINTSGLGIQNEPKIPAVMTIRTGSQLLDSVNIGIEFRGSTSFRISDKKSYGIEIWDESGNDIDHSFFGFPEEEDWILMGHVVNAENNFIFDRTLMYHYLGYTLSNQFGRYASRGEFVELMINDQYLGVYIFMEKLKRDNNRIDIEKLDPGTTTGDLLTGGYILKIDKTAGGDLNLGEETNFLFNWDDDARYSEAISFRSDYSIDGEVLDFEPFRHPYHLDQWKETYFLYEYPKAEEINIEQKEYIQNYIHEFETALLEDDFQSGERTYTDYIDLDSFAEYFLLNELVRNVDGYRLSTYLQKDVNGKLRMGPIWDLNIGYDSGDRIPTDDWVINYNVHVSRDSWMMPFWWPRLMEDPLFRSAVKDRWEELNSGALSIGNILSVVDETANYLIENGAIQRNYERWNQVEVDYSQSIDNLRSYLIDRVEWMNGEIQNF